MIQSQLRDRWFLSDSPFSQLIAAYSSSDRYYHNLDHLYQVLCTIEQLHPTHSLTLNVAAWFHDAVYDTHATDNEEKSATLAEEILRGQNLLIPQVRRLILSTKTHQAFDSESEILLDADLAILSSEQYENYATAIRQEYFWVGEEDYRIGRSRILESFLTRDCIYYRMPERDQRARENLRSELRRLQESRL